MIIYRDSSNFLHLKFYQVLKDVYSFSLTITQIWSQNIKPAFPENVKFSMKCFVMSKLYADKGCLKE